MPLYEFDCLQCTHPFEKLVRSAREVDGVVCPTCGSSYVQKRLSLVARVVQSDGAIPLQAAPTAQMGGCCGGACGCSH